MLRFKQYMRLEAYSIPISNASDIDNFDTKYPKKELKKLFKHVKSLKLDDIPKVGSDGTTKTESGKIKVRSAGTKQDEITTQGNVYISKIKKNEIIIKRSLKDNEEYNFELLKEYFIGLFLNYLRIKIPNFMYVFGIIKCSEPSKNTNLLNICKNYNYNFLLLEKINGNTFR